MKKQKELLIIMPAYNEEKNIEAVLYELEKPEISSIADILVMNDASSDSTNWVVKAHGHTLVTHVFNLGYGSALQLGYKYAIRRKYKYVIQMDADGQHDVCNIPKIYERLRQKDADGIWGMGQFLPVYRCTSGVSFCGRECSILYGQD